MNTTLIVVISTLLSVVSVNVFNYFEKRFKRFVDNEFQIAERMRSVIASVAEGNTQPIDDANELAKIEGWNEVVITEETFVQQCYNHICNSLWKLEFLKKTNKFLWKFCGYEKRLKELNTWNASLM